MRSESKPDPVIKAASIINGAIKQSWNPSNKIVKGSAPLILQNITMLKGQLSPNGMAMLAKMFPALIKPEGAPPPAATPELSFQGQPATYSQGNTTVNAPTTVQGGQPSSYQDLLASRLPAMRPFNGNTQNVNISMRQPLAPAAEPQMPMPQGEI